MYLPLYLYTNFLPVAEVFGTFVSIDDERIIQSFHVLCYIFYGMQSYGIYLVIPRD